MRRLSLRHKVILHYGATRSKAATLLTWFRCVTRTRRTSGPLCLEQRPPDLDRNKSCATGTPKMCLWWLKLGFNFTIKPILLCSTLNTFLSPTPVREASQLSFISRDARRQTRYRHLSGSKERHPHSVDCNVATHWDVIQTSHNRFLPIKLMFLCTSCSNAVF